MGIDPEELYTVEQAAELLHVSRRTVQRHLRSGLLRARRLGKRVLIPGFELLDLPPYIPAPQPPPVGAFALTLGYLAQRVAGGNLVAMAKMLNDAGADPRLDELEPDATAPVDRLTVIDLFAHRAGDTVGHRLRQVLSETMGD